MRLRTEMVGGKDYKWPRGCRDELLHDAAVAHALVQAISEIGVTKDGMYAECCIASDTQSFLRRRAEEVMREWGYGDECG